MTDAFREEAVVFECEGESLVGVLSLPAAPATRGVLIVVGGPQYRVGSHRQFTLLARHLAAHGIPSLRFDYRGMGDSSGAVRSFEAVDADIRRAIDIFYERVSGLESVVIWGLCDAASAALFYAHRDARVGGLVLLNPWVRTPEGMARTVVVVSTSVPALAQMVRSSSDAPMRWKNRRSIPSPWIRPIVPAYE